MSIRAAIKSHEGNELFRVSDGFFGETARRHIYASDDVTEFIDRVVDDRAGHIGRNVKGLMDYFIEGELPITVGWNPHDKGNCIMARVDSKDPDYEIWDFRCLDPEPGAWVLGGWAEFNVFVALIHESGEHVHKDFPGYAALCIDEWKRLFGPYLKPHRARTLDGYLSKPFKAV